jgi:signal transduction histidine kinase
VLVTGFYVLFGWRSYVERDRYLEHLRPFMAGPRVYDALLKQDPLQVDEAGAFAALCGGVLEARVAYLGAVGPLAVLAGPPLAYPPDTAPLAVFPDATAGGAAPDRLCFSVDPDRYGGAQWAVPLWSERGLIGLLLLGRKKSGGLYTQEEIEIARASAERLIDTLACARMAQTLMALQRRRLTDHQVENRRVHRAVHDEVLPRLHAAMLTAGASADTWTTETRPQLMEVHRQLSDLLRDMPPPTGLALARHGVVGMLRQAIENEFAESLDAVSWEIDPAAEEQARALPPVAAEVLFYAACEAIRNAARHGRGAGPQRPLHLRIAVTVNDAIETVIEDDGVGFDAMGGNAGRHGIALHGTMMAVVSGRWLTESAADRGTRVTLSIPLRP